MIKEIPAKRVVGDIESIEGNSEPFYLIDSDYIDSVHISHSQLKEMNVHPDENEMILREHTTNLVCSECDNSPLLDRKIGEWYCPIHD